MDDDFGGFEAAPSSNTQIPQTITDQKSQSNLPEWILGGQANTLNHLQNDINNNQIEILKEELSRTKEQLLDQKTNYIQLQTQQRQDATQTNEVYKQFQTMLNQALVQQRDLLTKEFRQAQHEQELSLIDKIREINIKFEKNLNEKFECKLAEFQETLIKHYESEFEDMEIKIKFLIDKQLKDTSLHEKDKLKQEFNSLESNLRQQNEKHMQKLFQSQSDLFKDQVKSTVLQEHLIHKDLINSKLEKLFRASEEKRRKTNILFSRHLNALNFFVDNSHKQMSVLRDAYKDMLKNKDIIDYYGEESGSSSSGTSNYSLSNLVSLVDPTLKISSEKTLSKDNLFDLQDDESLIDDELLK